MLLSCPLILKLFCWAALCLTLLLPEICSANLALSEYRLYFDGRTKNNSLLIRNTSNKNLDFKLVVTHKDMTEEGALIDVTPQQVEGRSAKTCYGFLHVAALLPQKGCKLSE